MHGCECNDRRGWRWREEGRRRCVREGLRRASLLAAWRIKSPRVAVSTVLVACVVLAVCALYVCMHAQSPTAHMYLYALKGAFSMSVRVRVMRLGYSLEPFFFGQGCLINNRVLSLTALSTFGLARKWSIQVIIQVLIYHCRLHGRDSCFLRKSWWICEVRESSNHRKYSICFKL
jgi:hypothetical protein